jgi:hypothetical protein
MPDPAEQCNSCRFWLPIPAAEPDEPPPLGTCHAVPPSVVAVGGWLRNGQFVPAGYETRWPETAPEKWCGCYEPPHPLADLTGEA